MAIEYTEKVQWPTNTRNGLGDPRKHGIAFKPKMIEVLRSRIPFPISLISNSASRIKTQILKRSVQSLLGGSNREETEAERLARVAD